MEREDNYLHHFHHQVSHNHQQTFAKTLVDDNNGVVDYMLNNPPPLPQLPPPPFPPYQHLNQQQQQQEMISSSGFCSTSTFSSVNSLDRLSFADVMQFADFGPKLGLTQTPAQNQTVRIDEVDEEDEEDPVYFLKFPVLNDNRLDDENDDGGGDNDQSLMVPQSLEEDHAFGENTNNEGVGGDIGGSSSVQIGFLGQKNPVTGIETSKNKRKRPRSIKTSEEVESQRMTHIAVERNRRKQMNEHLRVLRSLMPGSYVQRGDQASIIGGAIEFVRELEQLLQCLESQKRRRLFGDDSTSTGIIQQQQPPPQPQPSPPLFFPPSSPMPPLLPNNNNDQMKLNVVDLENGILLQEETAEKKSCLADVEVKLLGFDAVIKILCRRRPGQLIKTIAALEDLQLNILHTNITTIEQTVLYSFNVKVGNESQFSADDIASSVQQVFSFIHANSI